MSCWRTPERDGSSSAKAKERSGEFTGGRPENLAALFAGEENPDTRLYHRLIQEREETVYYGALSRWCEEHGIALMGHPHESDDIEMEKYFQIPGQDLVLRRLAPETGGVSGADSTMAKCSADAARLMGRRRNANECFGACNRDGNPWQFSGGDMKWYLDWLAVRGVNLFIPHAFYYSIAGKRKEERPPDVGPNSIWWPYYNQWADYMRRLSCLMTDVKLHADVAVPCPAFVLERWDRKKGIKDYSGKLTLEEGAWSAKGNARPVLTLQAEEMAELKVNGKSAGAGFWPPQVFDLTGLLKEGENRLELRVTGNMANRYGSRPVWYGLKEACKSSDAAV